MIGKLTYLKPIFNVLLAKNCWRFQEGVIYLLRSNGECSYNEVTGKIEYTKSKSKGNHLCELIIENEITPNAIIRAF